MAEEVTPDTAESVAEKAKQARRVSELFRTMTTDEFVNAITEKTVALPEAPTTVTRKIAAGLPVAESQLQVVRVLFPEMPLGVHLKSIIRQCLDCGTFIHVGPRTQAIVEADQSIQLVCYVCAAYEASQNPSQVLGLGNKD